MMRTVAGFLCSLFAFPSFAQTLPIPTRTDLPVSSSPRQKKQSPEAKPSDAPPQTAKEYAQRGLRYVQSEDFARALPDIDRAMELAPDVAVLHYLRGGILIKLGQRHRAFADFDRAIHLQPDFAPAYPGRACVYYVKKQYDRVLADCERAIQLDPTLSDAFRYRGMVYQKQGKRAEALNDFNEVIRLVRVSHILVAFMRGKKSAS
jgi:tetratricopeptide (TPR) repeat protein